MGLRRGRPGNDAGRLSERKLHRVPFFLVPERQPARHLAGASRARSIDVPRAGYFSVARRRPAMLQLPRHKRDSGSIRKSEPRRNDSWGNLRALPRAGNRSCRRRSRGKAGRRNPPRGVQRGSNEAGGPHRGLRRMPPGTAAWYGAQGTGKGRPCFGALPAPRIAGKQVLPVVRPALVSHLSRPARRRRPRG